MRYCVCVLGLLLFFSCGNKSEGVTDDRDNDTVPLSFVFSSACIESPNVIGEFMNQMIAEGGFSGLTYIPNTDLEFFAVTDRGPNTSLKKFLGNEGAMLFPFPEYTQKIIRLKFANGSFQIVSVHPILSPNGEPICGFPAERSRNEGTESAVVDLKGTAPNAHDWNFDLEGISLDSNGDFWLVDEYRPAIVYVDGKTFKIKTVFSAEEDERDVFKLIDKDFALRQPNRGFEGVAITPSGKVLAILQSPLDTPELYDSIPNRLLRILQLDPVSGSTKWFGFEMSVDLIDPKIGDFVAMNDHEFLVIEHGKDANGKVAHVIRVDLEHATDVSEIHFNIGTSFEGLKNNSKAQYKGIILAQKSMVFDLISAGFNPEYGKPEGLAIVDARTISVVNDNDFGIQNIDENGALILNNQPSCIFHFEFNRDVFK